MNKNKKDSAVNNIQRGINLAFNELGWNFEPKPRGFSYISSDRIIQEFHKEEKHVQEEDIEKYINKNRLKSFSKFKINIVLIWNNIDNYENLSELMVYFGRKLIFKI